MSTADVLRPCELFMGLDAEELEEIASIAREERYEAGEIICAEHEVAERLFILCDGRVEVTVSLDSPLEPGGEVTIQEVEPGRVFGWSSMVKQRRFTASVRALETATVLAITADDLNTLFDRNAHAGFVIMKQLAEVIASRLRSTRTACAREPQED